MVQPAGGDSRFAYMEAISAGNVGEIATRGHRLEIHREIRVGHLRFKDALQAVASDKLGSKTVKVKFVLRRIERRKKRNALNVVPVVMRHQNFGFNVLIGVLIGRRRR